MKLTVEPFHVLDDSWEWLGGLDNKTEAIARRCDMDKPDFILIAISLVLEYVLPSLEGLDFQMVDVAYYVLCRLHVGCFPLACESPTGPTDGRELRLCLSVACLIRRHKLAHMLIIHETVKRRLVELMGSDTRAVSLLLA